MIDMVAVKFDSSNNINYFSSNGLKLKKNDMVVVETENGIELGVCRSNIFKEKNENINITLKKVIRKASKEDLEKNKKNINDSLKALDDAKLIAMKLHLKMQFIEANYTFDRKQLYFSYLSDERVDFRELAKKLAQKYKTRIELRQIGVRDKAKMVGGLGPCGLFLCCNSFLTDFNSVSINMAKNQFLALNPSKINGVCGRLLCCLNYENETYKQLRSKLPKIGTYVETKSGMGKVVGIDIFSQTYTLEISKNNVIEVSCGD